MDARTSALAALLDDELWRAADLETRRLLIEDADVGGYIGVDPNEASELDCSLLMEIDAAWAEASNGHFGFLTQERVLAEVMDAGYAANETWRQFGRRVGWVHEREWIDDDDVDYRIEAPEGHLPYVPGSGTAVNTGRVYEGFMRFYARVGSCVD